MIDWSIWDILCDEDGLFRYTDEEDDKYPTREYDFKDASEWTPEDRKDIREAARKKFGKNVLASKRDKLKLKQYTKNEYETDTAVGNQIEKKLNVKEKFTQYRIAHIERGERWPTDPTELKAIADTYELSEERDVFYLLAAPPEPTFFDLDYAKHTLSQISRQNQRSRYKDAQEGAQVLKYWLSTKLTPFDPVEKNLRDELEKLVTQTYQELEQAKKGLEMDSQTKSIAS